MKTMKLITMLASAVLVLSACGGGGGLAPAMPETPAAVPVVVAPAEPEAEREPEPVAAPAVVPEPLPELLVEPAPVPFFETLPLPELVPPPAQSRSPETAPEPEVVQAPLPQPETAPEPEVVQAPLPQPETAPEPATGERASPRQAVVPQTMAEGARLAALAVPVRGSMHQSSAPGTPVVASGFKIRPPRFRGAAARYFDENYELDYDGDGQPEHRLNTFDDAYIYRQVQVFPDHPTRSSTGYDEERIRAYVDRYYTNHPHYANHPHPRIRNGHRWLGCEGPTDGYWRCTTEWPKEPWCSPQDSRGRCSTTVGERGWYMLNVYRYWQAAGVFGVGYDVTAGTWYDLKAKQMGVFWSGPSIDNPTPLEQPIHGTLRVGAYGYGFTTTTGESGIFEGDGTDNTNTGSNVGGELTFAGATGYLTLNVQTSLATLELGVSNPGVYHRLGDNVVIEQEPEISGIRLNASKIDQAFVYQERYDPKSPFFGTGEQQLNRENDVVSGNGRGQFGGVISTGYGWEHAHTAADTGPGPHRRTHPTVYGTLGLTEIKGHEGLSLIMLYRAAEYPPPSE